MARCNIYPLLACGMLVLAVIGLSGCDEPVYEQGPEPAAAAPAEPEAPVRSGTTGGGSAYGGAVGAAQRTSDRVADQQRRIQEEIDNH